MKTFSQSSLLALTVLLSALCPCTLQAEKTAEAGIQRYGNLPVQATGLKKFPGRKVTLKSYANGKLTVAIEGMEGGKASLKTNDQLAEQLNLILPDAQKLNRALASKDYQSALPLLRKAAYPLLRFSTLPGSFTPVYQVIDALFEALNATGKYPEAIYLAGEYPGLMTIASLQPTIIKSLDAMRMDGKYNEILAGYQTMAESGPEATRPQALIWTAYCHAALGDSAKAQAVLETVTLPKDEEDGFDIYYFVTGMAHYKQKDFPAALDAMAQGLTYATPTESWIAEATYYLADSYRQIANYEAALGAYQEVFKLNQDPLWAERAKNAHTELTEFVKKLKEKQAAIKKAAAEKAAAEKATTNS